MIEGGADEEASEGADLAGTTGTTEERNSSVVEAAEADLQVHYNNSRITRKRLFRFKYHMCCNLQIGKEAAAIGEITAISVATSILPGIGGATEGARRAISETETARSEGLTMKTYRPRITQIHHQVNI